MVGLVAGGASSLLATSVLVMVGLVAGGASSLLATSVLVMAVAPV